MSRLLSPRELSELLSLSVNHLAILRMTGEGPIFFKLGNGSRSAVRYKLADVETWLESRRRRSTCDPGENFDA